MRDPDAPCLDSTQAYFCRDLWVDKAGETMEEFEPGNGEARNRKRGLEVIAEEQETKGDDVKEDFDRRKADAIDADANAGSDYDAMPDSDVPLAEAPAMHLTIPNSVYRPARILINPRCVTTYAGVEHTKLALDLFGPDRDESSPVGAGKYVLEDWEGAPESFICQEQVYVPFALTLVPPLTCYAAKLVDEKLLRVNDGLDSPSTTNCSDVCDHYFMWTNGLLWYSTVSIYCRYLDVSRRNSHHGLSGII